MESELKSKLWSSHSYTFVRGLARSLVSFSLCVRFITIQWGFKIQRISLSCVQARVRFALHIDFVFFFLFFFRCCCCLLPMRLFLFYIFLVHLSSILCIWRERKKRRREAKQHVNHTPNTKCHCIASSQHLSVRCCIIDFGASKYFFLEIHDSRKLYDVRLSNMPPSSSPSPPCHILHSIIIIYTTIWLIYLSAGKQASERATSNKGNQTRRERKKRWRKKYQPLHSSIDQSPMCCYVFSPRTNCEWIRTRSKDNMWKRNEVIKRMKRIEWGAEKKLLLKTKSRNRLFIITN